MAPPSAHIAAASASAASNFEASNNLERAFVNGGGPVEVPLAHRTRNLDGQAAAAPQANEPMEWTPTDEPFIATGETDVPPQGVSQSVGAPIFRGRVDQVPPAAVPAAPDAAPASPGVAPAGSPSSQAHVNQYIHTGGVVHVQNTHIQAVLQLPTSPFAAPAYGPQSRQDRDP